MSANESNTTLLEFPCRFPIKAFGKHQNGFVDTVFTIVSQHAPTVTRRQLTTRESRSGKYLSVTVEITAESQRQLDAIYQDLTDSGRVLMSL